MDTNPYKSPSVIFSRADSSSSNLIEDLKQLQIVFLVCLSLLGVCVISILVFSLNTLILFFALTSIFIIFKAASLEDLPRQHNVGFSRFALIILHFSYLISFFLTIYFFNKYGIFRPTCTQFALVFFAIMIFIKLFLITFIFCMRIILILLKKVHL